MPRPIELSLFTRLARRDLGHGTVYPGVKLSARYKSLTGRQQRLHSSTTTTDDPKSTANATATNVDGAATTATGSQDLPLSGLKVLDLSRVLAGPFCTQILADYGADVIKVEQPGQGDETRQWRTHGETQQKWRASTTGNQGQPTMSLYFAAVNRNKRSMTVDLKSPGGKEVVKALARRSDVLVNNFLPGKMEQLGLGYDELRRDNKGLIYASVSGYGASGPSRDRAGYDAIALAEAGLLHITGDEEGGPTKPGVAIADLCTGLYTHGAILAALNQRHRTGVGCKIKASLFESALSLLINVGLAALNLDLDKGPSKRRRGKRLGLGHPNLVPYGGFETKDNKMFFVAANNNRQWKGFCARLGIDGLGDDVRFSTNDGRVENRDEINAILQKRFKEKTKDEWLAILEGSGLPYGAINDVVDALEHPQAKARDMVIDIDDFEAARDGVLKLIAPAVKFEGADMSVRIKPPLLGQHTDEILAGLGYGPAEVAELRTSGAV
ncbi:hypothetical protein HRR83_007295 [Exophiala dermatitidis]|uniref:Uncharacterized protein n=1 Tax=Exophiala dermatitidis TaxID=5970 RepID=A0AAN6ISS1_EXODE|nr:hypothetical protein HRR75_006002 [Exophiala dermatitidis]KAJ4511253.1 hypothetical protein HRR73_006586 [Exophiala dermatitidis]KAJ4511812.1 hypothetical protein HRR74_006546 [Exophiala dermatitidis]KAJ4534668.1 hypothetical protein HRR76_006582 [Exophiala dermatitidis]KAJ4545659.1 hypothetical protein HRR78_005933 [Exophiala dermatitidis]